MPLLEEGLQRMWRALHLGSIVSTGLRALVPTVLAESSSNPALRQRVPEILAKTALRGLRNFGGAQRSYVRNGVEIFESTLSEAAARGEITRPVEALARSQLRALRRGVQMADEIFERKAFFNSKFNASLQDLETRFGLGPNSDAWYPVMREIESAAGDPRLVRTPAAKAVLAHQLDAMKQMSPLLTEKELLEQYSLLWAQRLDPAVTQRVGRQVMGTRIEQVAKSIMENPRLKAVAASELGKPNPTNDEVVDLIVELVTAEGRGTKFRPIRGILGSPSGIVLRRAVQLPEEWRLHPYNEFVSTLTSEYTYAAEAGILGRDGRKAQALLRWSRGYADDLADLPEDYRTAVETLDRLMPAPYVQRTGEVQGKLADLVEGLLRSTTGAYQEAPFVWAARTSLVPLGAIMMMPFSAIPNLGQIYSELITKGFANWMFGWKHIFKDVETLRRFAVLAGQKQVAVGMTDVMHGVPETSRFFQQAGKTTPILSLFDPKWLGAAMQTMRVSGIRGLRTVAEESLKVYGFVSVEDFLRRFSALTTHSELRQLQRRLLADPTDAYALRQLRRYPSISSAQEFVRMQIPENVDEAVKMMWRGDPMDITRIDPLQRLYFHGIGGTQFNYIPGDYPAVFSHPFFGTVAMQFRRYTWAQATKVVAHAVNEFSAGNPVPLLYMTAAVPTLGYTIKRLKNLVSQREVVLAEGRPRIVEQQPIGEKGEARLLGRVLSSGERAQLENAMAMGLMGIYTDAMLTMSEGTPTMLASWITGVFPVDAFNLVNKMAQAGAEVVRGGEQLPGKERYPKVQEAARGVVRQVPLVGRVVAPHLRFGRARYEQLRDFAAAAFLSGNVRAFNDINRVLTEKFYAPVTFDDVVMWGYRQHLRELGTDPIGLRPGDPGYSVYRRIQEQEGRLRKKRPVQERELERARRRAEERTQEFFARFEEEEP